MFFGPLYLKNFWVNHHIIVLLAIKFNKDSKSAISFRLGNVKISPYDLESDPMDKVTWHL